MVKEKRLLWLIDYRSEACKRENYAYTELLRVDTEQRDRMENLKVSLPSVPVRHVSVCLDLSAVRGVPGT